MLKTPAQWNEAFQTDAEWVSDPQTEPLPRHQIRAIQVETLDEAQFAIAKVDGDVKTLAACILAIQQLKGAGVR